MLQVRWKLGSGSSPGKRVRRKPMLACSYEPAQKVTFSAAAHEVKLKPAAAAPPKPSVAAMTHDEFFQLSHDFAAVGDEGRIDLTELYNQNQSKSMQNTHPRATPR